MRPFYLLILIFFFLLFVTGGLLGIIGSFQQLIIKDVPCYDKHENVIQNQICTEKTYPYYDVAPLFLIIGFMGMGFAFIMESIDDTLS